MGRWLCARQLSSLVEKVVRRARVRYGSESSTPAGLPHHAGMFLVGRPNHLPK